MVHTSQKVDSELQLIEQTKQDPSCFKPLYDHYYKPIFLFVLRRVGEKNVCADITSQVFLKALQNIKRYQFRNLPFSAWLYRIAINEVNDFFRLQARQRFVVIEEGKLDSLHAELVEDFSLDHLQQQLEKMLQRLEPGELHMIELRFFEERPFKEVAMILNITEVHAKVRTYRIVDKLRKYFTEKK